MHSIGLLIIIHTLFSLVLFSALVSVIVLLLRKPLRQYKPLDLAIFERVNRLTGPRMNGFMLAITFLGKHQFLVPANLLLIGYFIWFRHQSWFSIRMATIALSSLLLMFLLKYLFHRKRPLAPLLKAARGLSFPSGHAIMAVTFFGLLLYIFLQGVELPIFRWLISIPMVTLIGLIGFSRVYLRVHYASDVLAGFIIGTAWLLISLSFLQRVQDTLPVT